MKRESDDDLLPPWFPWAIGGVTAMIAATPFIALLAVWLGKL